MPAVSRWVMKEEPAYRTGVHRVPVGAGVHTARQLANNLIRSLFSNLKKKCWVKNAHL